ncbi:MAG: phenylacetate--CoA ligase family protein [Thermoleophilia bacterium]|nr:phenylacetate--CoA ligase family protein [Thermoleophilia bacterium]
MGGEFRNREIETMTPAELARIQEEKLARQVRYVYERAPFYRKKLSEAGLRPEDVTTLGGLARVPFTTKDELRDSQLADPPLGSHAAVPLADAIRVHSSTGTTGRPSFVGITRHDASVWTDLTARSLHAQGLRPQDIVLHAAGLTMFVGGLPVKDAIEHIGATFVPIGTGASEKAVMALQVLKANVLHCTPSYAIYLAEYVRANYGLAPQELGLERITVGAEPGGGIPAVRQRIQNEWGARLTEGMGNADMAPIIFGECFEQGGMHFNAQEYIIPEIIDPESGERLAIEQGVSGEMVYTAIDRECCPLLRFRTRDRVIVTATECSCGRTSFRIRCVGRTDDMLIVLGVNVFPSAVKDTISSLVPETTGEMQIVLDAPGPKVAPPLRIMAEYGNDVTDLPALKTKIEGLIKDRLTILSKVELVPPETLPRYDMKGQLVRKAYEEAR